MSRRSSAVSATRDRTRPHPLAPLALIAAFLGLAACSSSDDPAGPGPGGGSSGTELAQVLRSAGDFEDVTPSYSETDATEEETQVGQEQYFCTRKTVTLTEGYSDYPQFDPNSQIIFPGNLPARTTYTMERITSREQLGVAIRAEYNRLSTDITGSFDYASDVSYNRFLVKLTQSYYTIAFEAPTDPGDFFGPAATVEQLVQYVGPGNPAAYVSSVTYGRVFYLLIQSTDSVQEVEASVSGSFRGAVAGGSLDADVTYVKELSSVKIGGYAIGGDAGQAAAALTGDYEALETFIAEGGTITTGQPLSHTVNAASDPAKQLKVKVATEYDVVDCSPLGLSLPNGVADANGGFGGIGFGDIVFRELQMYDYVPTQAQRRALETSLMERWSL